MGGISLQRLARQCRSRVRRPDLFPCRHSRGRGDREAASRGGRALRTARETSVIIRRGDEFLMLHRAIDDYWHVVAGVVEDGETFAEAAARELREETALDAPVVDVRMPQGYRVPDEMRSEYLTGVNQVAIENFTVEVPMGWEPVLNEEHDSYKWLTRDDAVAIAHWPETKEVLTVLAESTA
ncbi:MAG: NUDIX domain-containing protein [Chloroflexi bacterium]|nr:MAG: NUDIX domain-containing protein [Chloroflexota bacterium]